VILLWTGRKDTVDGERIYGYDKPLHITDTQRGYSLRKKYNKKNEHLFAATLNNVCIR